jgi:hypothetical protein
MDDGDDGIQARGARHATVASAAADSAEGDHAPDTSAVSSRHQNLRARMAVVSGWFIPPPSPPLKSDKDLRREREAKVCELGRRGLLRSERLRRAMLSVRREDFIPSGYRDHAYRPTRTSARTLRRSTRGWPTARLPCDAPWSEEDVERVRRWIDAGMAA